MRGESVSIPIEVWTHIVGTMVRRLVAEWEVDRESSVTPITRHTKDPPGLKPFVVAAVDTVFGHVGVVRNTRRPWTNSLNREDLPQQLSSVVA